jgi:hypothetical protein
VIIRISSARDENYKGSPQWWSAAKRAAAAGRAPHGLHQLLLDERVTHVDVFPTEVSAVWDWCASFDGWVFEGRKQLKSEPLDSTKSSAVHLPDESLDAVRGKNA